MEQLAVMIKEILDASKAEKTDMQDDKEIDLSELVEQIAEPYQMIAKSKGICIKIDIPQKSLIFYPVSILSFHNSCQEQNQQKKNKNIVNICHT